MRKYSMITLIWDFIDPRKTFLTSVLAFENNSEPTDEEIEIQSQHSANKEMCIAEKNIHRKNTNTRDMILTFDLENLLYRNPIFLQHITRNLTANCHNNSLTYCRLCHEGVHGSAGNDIASAIVKFLTAACLDNPDRIFHKRGLKPNLVESTTTLKKITFDWLEVEEVTEKVQLTDKKKEHLQSMLKYIPEKDREIYLNTSTSKDHLPENSKQGAQKDNRNIKNTCIEGKKTI
ncbi:hypothetical protein HHI36_005189 [Cryptolaemus montrouzieri]|uniref:Uncharacterized protein n=1 Tax=Cryptolaemus montrouzieri TaxID=559131 RepID=A0ABD2NTE9_9CUCU